MNIIRGLLLRFIFIIILLVSCLVYVSTTNSGLKLLINITNLISPTKIQVTNLHGKLWGTLYADNVIYKHKKSQVAVSKLKINWRLLSVYPLNILLDEFNADEVKNIGTENSVKLHNFKLKGSYKSSLQLQMTTSVVTPQGNINVRMLAKDKNIIGNMYLDTNKLSLIGPIQGPWQIHAEIPKLDKLHNSLSNLQSTLIVDAKVYDLENILLNAKLTAGHYVLPKEYNSNSIGFKGLALNSKLDTKGLSINVTAKIDANTHSRIKLELPKLKILDFDPDVQNITGQLDLNVDSLDFIEGIYAVDDFIINIDKPSGKLKANLKLTGILNQLKMLGELRIIDAKMSLPNLGIDLEPINLKVTTDAKSWSLEGLITTNNKESLTLKGAGMLSPEPQGKIILQGNNINLVNTDEYNITVSPQISCILKENIINIAGDINVPSAKISPITFTNTKTLTRDAILEEDKQDINPYNLNVNLNLIMGNDVQVKLKGLNGKLGGAVKIKQLPKQPLSLLGKIQLIDGKYEIYGQKLKIEQGDLIFSRQEIDNPYIQVRATRKFNNQSAQLSGSNNLLDFSAQNIDLSNFGDHTTVGIVVSGKINSPKVKLYSNPPNLSQEDILSLLLLGKPVSQLDKSGGQILIKAIASTNLGSNSKSMQTLQKIKKSLGIDLDVSNNSVGTTNTDTHQTKVSIGKSINKRVYLKYSDGIFVENSSVFTLTYLLNKFLSINVSDSELGNGIDITYTHSD